MRVILSVLFSLLLTVSFSRAFAECEPDDLECQMKGKVESGENAPALNPNKVDIKAHKKCQKMKESTKCTKNPDCYWDSTVKGGKCKGNGHN